MKKVLTVLAVAAALSLASCRTGRTLESILRKPCSVSGHGTDRKCGGLSCGTCGCSYTLHKPGTHQKHLCDCARSCECWSTRP